MSEHNHSIAGGWLGTYYYRGLESGRPPTRFEATFTLRGGDGRFTGAILDDGAGGEAHANGIQTGIQVAFTKTYLARKGGFLFPVEYEGMLSGDGATIKGVWRIRQARGVWEARRLWSEEAAGAAVTEGAERAESKELVRI